MPRYTRSTCVWLNYSVEADTPEEALAQLQGTYVESKFNELAASLPELAPFDINEGPVSEEWLELDGEAIIEAKNFDEITPDQVWEYLPDRDVTETED